MRIAILDDWQNLAKTSADWSRLKGKASVTFFTKPFETQTALVESLKPFDIIVPMRERTAFTKELLLQLPNLKMIALTGHRAQTLDLGVCEERGIIVSNTGGSYSLASTTELAWGLIISAARGLNIAERKVRSSGWNFGVPNGIILDKKRLGIVGLGKLGTRLSLVAKAFGMEVVAWSENLTKERCDAAGVTYVSKEELFKTADVVSLHLVLSPRSRHIVTAKELSMMKQDAILVNTSRGPLIEEGALIAAIHSGKIRVGLDVFDQEPLPKDHVLRKAKNVSLSPHLGYSAAEAFVEFYQQSLENVEAFLAGKPIREIKKL